jgi:subfamily B ATP-binding cassette protein MsbA
VNERTRHGNGAPGDRAEQELLWQEARSSATTFPRDLLALISGKRRGPDEGTGGSVNLRRLLGVARPYRARLVVALVIVLLGSLVSLGATLTWRYLVDSVTPGGNPDVLDRVALVLLGLYVLRSTLGLASGYLLNVVGLRLTMDLRFELFRHLQTLPLRFFTERRVGELVSRVMNDVQTVRGVLTGDLSGLLQQTVLFVGALAFILVIDWRLSLLMFVLVPAVSVVSILLGRALRRLSAEVTDGFAAVHTVLEEALSGVRTVRSFVRESYEVGRFRDHLGRLLGIALRRMMFEIVFGPLLSALFFSSTVVIIWYGGKQVLAGEISTGQLVTFILLTSVIGGSIRWVGGLWTRLQSALGSCDRIFRLLDVENEIQEPSDAVSLPPLEGRVRFERVSFAYRSSEPDREAPAVLHDVDLEVTPGEKLAIVGPSGAGKSTLMHLVPRFYDPSAGRVLVDGADLRTVRLDSLRTQIGFVPQETHLFGGTVRDNLLYGRLDASDEELVAAARAANAHQFVSALENGYETIVGEKGIRLSGGQRQRLAIARVLLEDPRILLLDEATSALDSESERLVQEALDRLMEGRTTLVVAHRLSTVQNADRIAVLDGGRVVELGTHEELLAVDRLYARLYRQQLHDPADPGPMETARS